MSDDVASPSDDAPKTDAGVPVATDLSLDDDLVAGIMDAFLGPDSADILTADERVCMNQVLSPSFPTARRPGSS